jgi:hypothetical protein
MPQNENPETEKSILCLGCARVVPKDADFCPHCGAPLSSTSTTDPYKSVFAEGQMYWRLTHGPLKPIVIVGFAMLFAVNVTTMVYIGWRELTYSPSGFTEKCLNALLLTASSALSVALAVAVIRNYRRQKKSGPHE